ncbi:uncharacterized protein LOC111041405 [Myzus persicae]|uniref:uncharacterized protein LOC111041405 n=1 Tax=Myzus persicae TaxID=13164 RepID=UPI000B939493|nr:uncharacterized protein LOC111041405 [Myzus persicae]
MNGIIEYDQKLTSLPRFLFIHQHSQKKSCWNLIFIFTITFYLANTFLLMSIWRPSSVGITMITSFYIRIEFIVDISVIFSTYFVLQQLEYRLQTLNDSWKYLLPGFLVVPAGELTHSITGITMDKIRLLHAELSDLLRIFSVGYGQMLLGFFVFSYINMVLNFHYIINHNSMEREEFTSRYFLKNVAPYISSIKNVIFILWIIIAASRVHEKKRRMISNLRLIRISNLPANLKIQVKMFMNQILVFESSEITGFGIFNINLNLVVTIIILLITGLVTLIQLKEHPFMKQSVLKLKNYLRNVTAIKVK